MVKIYATKLESSWWEHETRRVIKKDSNSTYSYEAAAEAVEDKPTGTLLIESENENNYVDLNRSLINSITQGRNRYPVIKYATYTPLCSYATKRLKNENKSTETCYRQNTGISLYQRANKVDGTQISGGNIIIEEMITFWYYGLCRHIPLLCTKSNTKGFQGMQFIFTKYIQPSFIEKLVILCGNLLTLDLLSTPSKTANY